MTYEQVQYEVKDGIATITLHRPDMRRSFASADFKEGVAHFLEKRPPTFTGR